MKIEKLRALLQSDSGDDKLLAMEIMRHCDSAFIIKVLDSKIGEGQGEYWMNMDNPDISRERSPVMDIFIKTPQGKLYFNGRVWYEEDCKAISITGYKEYI